MTKEEIIKAIWNELPNFTLNELREIYETIINLIKDRLSKGEKVELRGFGIFKIREKNERMGRNPKSGQEAVIKPRKVITFQPSKMLKNKVIDTSNYIPNITEKWRNLCKKRDSISLSQMILMRY